MDSTRARTMTVICTSGLSNRLRVLLSGMVIAEATGRQFAMLWPRTTACSADYAELFATTWPVQPISVRDWDAMQHTFTYENGRRDLLNAPAAELRIVTSHKLLAPERHPSHKLLMNRMEELLEALQPISEIAARIEAYQAAAFRPHMVGVHLRRGDLQVYDPARTANTQPAIKAVDGCLLRHPDAGIFLCTDDGAPNQYSGRPLRFEDVRTTFIQRYGDRVTFTTPRSLDRREVSAIQDALVDLWLLRRTDCFVGTAGSSFSDLAFFGRSIPTRLCQSEHPLRHLFPVVTWLKGENSLEWLARYYWKFIRPLFVR